MADETVAQTDSTSVTTPAPVVTKQTISHEEASDLPELDWGFRRGYVFAVTTADFATLWAMPFIIKNEQTLRMVEKYLLWLLFLLCFLYLAGASAEKVVQITAALRTTRKEQIITSPGGDRHDHDPN